VDATIADASVFADALRALGAGRDLLFVASLNTSASLSARAPLGHRPEAARLDRDLVDALETDAGRAGELAVALHDVGGSCGAGPLAAFSLLFAGTPASVLGYEHPAGVGYLGALVEPVHRGPR
jgi:hypothetical protein